MFSKAPRLSLRAKRRFPPTHSLRFAEQASDKPSLALRQNPSHPSQSKIYATLRYAFNALTGIERFYNAPTYRESVYPATAY